MNASLNLVSAHNREIEISIGDVLTLMALSVNVYSGGFGGVRRFAGPIDDSALVSGSPIWGAILGIAKRNNIVMGAVSHPMLAEGLVAVGGTTYYRGCNAEFKRLPLQFPLCGAARSVCCCYVVCGRVEYSRAR